MFEGDGGRALYDIIFSGNSSAKKRGRGREVTGEGR